MLQANSYKAHNIALYEYSSTLTLVVTYRQYSIYPKRQCLKCFALHLIKSRFIDSFTGPHTQAQQASRPQLSLAGVAYVGLLSLQGSSGYIPVVSISFLFSKSLGSWLGTLNGGFQIALAVQYHMPYRGSVNNLLCPAYRCASFFHMRVKYCRNFIYSRGLLPSRLVCHITSDQTWSDIAEQDVKLLHFSLSHLFKCAYGPSLQAYVLNLWLAFPNNVSAFPTLSYIYKTLRKVWSGCATVWAAVSGFGQNCGLQGALTKMYETAIFQKQTMLVYKFSDIHPSV